MSTGNNPEHMIFYITDEAYRLALKIAEQFPGAEVLKFSSRVFSSRWGLSGNIICIMAAGIVVRTIAPLLKDKKSDPAVVVLDEKGHYVISLLSGHIGGANKLARMIADYLCAQAVITTASDVQGRTALDVWAVEHGLYIEDFEKIKRLSAKIVNGHKINVYADCSFDADSIPPEFVMVEDMKDAEMMITEKIMETDSLFLRPRNIFAGIGCNRGTTKEEISEAVKDMFFERNISMNSIRCLATIDLKADERGLVEFAANEELSIDFFKKDELNDTVSIYNMEASEVVKGATGALAVAEPSAMLAAKKRFDNAALITPKQKRGNLTLAIVKAKYTL